MKTEKKNISVKRIRAFLFLLLFIALVTGGIWLYNSADRLLGNYLVKLVAKETENKFQLKFDSLSFSLRTGTLLFWGLELEASKTIVDDAQQPALLFSCSTLSVHKINLLSFIRNRELHAESFLLESPYAEMGSSNPFHVQNLRTETVQAGDSVSIPIFTTVSFDTMFVRNAKIEVDSLIYLPPGASLPLINLEALDFNMGGIKKTNVPFLFDVSDIFIKINEINHNLSDMIHTVHVGEFSFSLINREINLLNSSLAPVGHLANTTDNRYFIDVPKIVLRTHHVERLLVSDTIGIDYAEMIEPRIKIKFGDIVEAGTPLNELNFYKLIENELDWLRIDEVAMTKADLQLIPSGGEELGQHLQGLNMRFFRFMADPSSYRDPKRILSSDGFELGLEKLTLNHADQIHRFEVNHLKIDTRLRNIETGSVSFKPATIDTERKDIAYIDISSGGLLFRGFSFLDAYHRQVFPMKELIINQPNITVRLPFDTVQNQQKRDQSLLLDKVDPYLKGIYVDQVNIGKGSMQYFFFNRKEEQGAFRTDFLFHLKELSVDRNTFENSDKLFFAKDFDLFMSEVRLDLADRIHRLTTDSLSLSSKGETAHIHNLALFPYASVGDSLLRAEKMELFNLHFPSIVLDGANLHQAFFKQVLFIENFEIEKPVLKFEKYGKWEDKQDHEQSMQSELYSLFSDFLLRIQIKNLGMNEGKLRYTQYIQNKPEIDLTNQFTVRLTNFELDSLSSLRKNKLFFSDVIDLSLKDQTFDLADGVHRVEAKEIAIFTGRNRLFIRDAKLYPNKQSEQFSKTPVAFYADIPLIQADGVKVSDFFLKGSIPIDKLSFLQPKIEILFQPHLLGAKTDTLKKPLLIPKEINDLTAGMIEIENGILRLSDLENNKTYTFAQSKIGFRMDGLKVDRKPEGFNTSYQDFSIALSETRFDLPDEAHHISIGNLDYRYSIKDVLMSGLHLRPIPSKPNLAEKNYFDVLVPSLRLREFDIDQLFEKNELVAGELELANPMITLDFTDRREGEPFNPYRLNLYASVKKHLKSIRMQSVTISNADISMPRKDGFRLKNIDLSGKSFVLDEHAEKGNRLLYFGKIDAAIRDYEGITDNKFYRYTIRKIEAGTDGNILLSDVKFVPTMSSEDFFRKKKFQDDYWQFTIKQANGRGIDWKRFIENGEWKIAFFEMDFGEVDVFRDKRLPISPSRKGLLPQQLLRELEVPVLIDSALFRCPKFTYQEWITGAHEQGSVHFTALRATIRGIESKRKPGQGVKPLSLLVDGMLMGEAPLSIEGHFNLLSPQNEFFCRATCGSIELNRLNSIIEPSMKISVREGTARELRTYFSANEDSSSGEMFFSYDNLKVSVLSNRQGMLREERFLSFLVNNIALKTQNPKQGKELEPVKFSTARDKQRSVINYLWRSVYEGLRNTLGIKDKEREREHAP